MDVLVHSGSESDGVPSTQLHRLLESSVQVRGAGAPPVPVSPPVPPAVPVAPPPPPPSPAAPPPAPAPPVPPPAFNGARLLAPSPHASGNPITNANTNRDRVVIEIRLR